MAREISDATGRLGDDSVLTALAASVYNPTPERLRRRADGYVRAGARALACWENGSRDAA